MHQKANFIILLFSLVVGIISSSMLRPLTRFLPSSGMFFSEPYWLSPAGHPEKRHSQYHQQQQRSQGGGTSRGRQGNNDQDQSWLQQRGNDESDGGRSVGGITDSMKHAASYLNPWDSSHQARDLLPSDWLRENMKWMRQNMPGDMFEQIQDFLQESESGSGGIGKSLTSGYHETEKHYHVVLEVPGIAKDNLAVSFDQQKNCLIIEGRQRECFDEEKGKMVPVKADEFKKQSKQENADCIERRVREYLQLPEDIDSEHIKVSLKNGVLAVNIPKSEESQESLSKKNRNYLPIELDAE